MDNQRRLSQEQLQHAQQIAARIWCVVWHMKLKTRWADYAARRNFSAKHFRTRR